MSDFVTYQRVIKKALALLKDDKTVRSATERGRAEFAIRETLTCAKFARKLANEPGATTEDAALKLLQFAGCTLTQKNPRIGKHPDLFTSSPSDRSYGDGDTDVIVEDWRLCSPATLTAAFADPEAEPEDLQNILVEMQEYSDIARSNGDLDVLLADGMSLELAQRLVETDRRYGLKTPPFITELENLVEGSQQARIKPLVEYLKNQAKWQLDYETEPGQDGFERTYVDNFQIDLENTRLKILKECAAEVLEGDEDALSALEAGPQEEVEQALRDPAMFDISVNKNPYGRRSGCVWRVQVGTIEYQCEGAKYDEMLENRLNGGRETRRSKWVEDENGEGRWVECEPYEEAFIGIRDEDVDVVLKELEDNKPYVSIDRWERDKTRDKSLFERSFDMTILECEEWSVDACYDADKLKAAIAGLSAAKLGPEHDDVVYRYSGTNDSVAGASARGMYVAKLKPSDLRREGATQGICIGREENGHPRALREGRTQVYSIRTEAGKPKFTIELDRVDRAARSDYDTNLIADKVATGFAVQLPHGGVDALFRIAEVKGKANRIPGFEAGKDTFTKPDDVRLVTDFLMHLGFSPEAIGDASDTAPGVEAMKEKGVDPFKPPPAKKARPHRDPRQQPKENPTWSPGVRASSTVRSLLRRAKPMGTYRPARW